MDAGWYNNVRKGLVCENIFKVLFSAQLSLETLSSAEASFIFFVRAGKWEEVKSKRAKPGEIGKWKRAGDTGKGEREKKRRLPPFCFSRRPLRSPYFFHFRVFLSLFPLN